MKNAETRRYPIMANLAVFISGGMKRIKRGDRRGSIQYFDPPNK
jgi:hypothetical protein